jgi:hypothetical protein
MGGIHRADIKMKGLTAFGALEDGQHTGQDAVKNAAVAGK